MSPTLSAALTWLALAIVAGYLIRAISRPTVTVNLTLDEAGIEALMRLGREYTELDRLERMAQRTKRA